jgi:putative ABC transport system ATP-binding protein
MEVLYTKNLTKIYGGRKGVKSTIALNGIELKVNKGEFVGVMGPSGSGKTTFLNILSGIDKPTTGSISISNKDITSFNRDEMALFRRRNLGLIFQDFNLIEGLTIEENINLPLVLENKSNEEVKYKTKEIMELFNIVDIKNKYPLSVSGGEQQRAAACRALISEPDIIMADEPTGNLDSKASKRFMKYLQYVNTERNATILMVTHDSYAASFCNRIVFIKDGKVYTEIRRKEEQRQFFDRILNCLAVLGGEINEF